MGDRKRHIVVKAETGMLVITPHGMAQISDDFFIMANAKLEKRAFPLARFYLLCASIEVGLKASILAEDCTAERKKHLRKLGHDLGKVHNSFTRFYPTIWDNEDLSAIESINRYYKRKSLEYFTSDLLGACFQGYRDLPDIEALDIAAQKVNSFVKTNNFFMDAKTTQPPSGGVLNAV